MSLTFKFLFPLAFISFSLQVQVGSMGGFQSLDKIQASLSRYALLARLLVWNFTLTVLSASPGPEQFRNVRSGQRWFWPDLTLVRSVTFRESLDLA